MPNGDAENYVDAVENVSINRISVKCPPFWRSNPALWFAQLESQFSNAGITTDATKYNQVVASIESEILEEVSDIVLNPPEANKYFTLKNKILERFSDSEQRKIHLLIKECTLGDRKPTQLFRQMKDLANNRVSDDFLKTMWMQRLPQNIQAILSASDDSIDKLLVMADRIVEVNDSSSNHINAISERWRRSIVNFSDWLLGTSSSNSNLQDEFSNNIVENGVDYSLPKLPVPDLPHTLCRYLEAVKPILSDKQYKYTEQLVGNFGSENGIGEKLQQMLEKRREIYANWAYDWWLDDMYMNNQVALPINSNPGMVFPLRPNAAIFGPLEMAQYAARLVTSALAFKDILDRNELPTETAMTDGKPQPLCMAQYYRIFTSYRLPGITKDSLMRSETEFTRFRPHIIVACNDQFYIIHLTTGQNADLVTENEIIMQMLFIIKDNMDKKPQSPSVGILTGLKRDSWATLREQLSKDENNQRNLTFIEKCMLIICFDLKELRSSFNSKYNYENVGHKTSTRDETSMAHQMIHGGGSTANTGNRWFDKTIQLVIGTDGVSGLCYEHSPAEGVAVINAVESMLKSCSTLESITDQKDPQIIPEKLTWNLTRNLEREIFEAKNKIDNFIQDLDFNVFRFAIYGKNFIKSCRVSPDAYIQLALQLTYFKLYGKLCATYESASTRRFLLGRVDCIRAETMEVLEWVSAMHDHNVEYKFTDPSKSRRMSITTSKDKKLELFHKAIRKQTEITYENINGQGIDIHLLGLRQTAKDYFMNADIFEDEAFAIANHFSLSTSQVTTKTDSFMGYGPVVPDGYGASYNSKEDSIIFCISSFYSNETTSTNRFTERLKESLLSMRDLLTNKN